MLTKVWLGGQSIQVASLGALGQGGEADVYDLGDGRVLKVYKTHDHPDVAGLPALEAAARSRLAMARDKLRAFPRHLPAHVVKPLELATRTKRPDDVVGYAMAKIDGEPLFKLCEPHWRRAHPMPADHIVALLRDLHVTLDAVHKAGVVIGDFNDTNVLTAAGRAWLIDADSWQYGRWTSTMFTERFVDPRLCAPDALVLAHPHDTDGDWFAYTVMLVRALLWTGPYGGVHAPADPRKRVAPAARPLARITIFDREVTYPKAAVPWQVLPDDLLDHLRAVFERDRRGRFPEALLDRLRFRRCTCGAEHARASCPVCRTTVAMPPAVIRGRVRAQKSDPSRIDRVRAPVWLDGANLMRQTAFGPEAIGQVLAGATRVWASETLGVGMWRAGGYTQVFVFRPDRRGLRDGIAIPRIRGALLDAHAVVGKAHAWLWWREALAGKETVRCAALDPTGAILGLAEAPADDAGWLASLRGACAIGPYLFVPTDAGIVRVEGVEPTRTFPDTADFVTAADELYPAPGGMYVRMREGALQLEIT